MKHRFYIEAESTIDDRVKKNKAREKIKKDTAKFLKNGGKIKVLRYGAVGNEVKSLNGHFSIKPYLAVDNAKKVGGVK